ncbi:MAG: porin family protein [candidate division Zixibacteria bacterium]|nr:porin family protein [candidate division Zixibacteria bacterium]
MKPRVLLSVLIAGLAIAAFTSSPLFAQSSFGYQGVTLGGAFGGHSGVSDLNQTGSTVDWRLGWAASADATLWLHQFAGLRASGSWAQDSLRGASLSGREKFNKFYYDGAVVLRYPVQAGTGIFTPYALGGAGAVSLHQLGSDETWTRFAGNFGAGLEYRVGRVGFRAEGRDFVYKFDEYGFDKTQHDVAWQGGLTLSL